MYFAQSIFRFISKALPLNRISRFRSFKILKIGAPVALQYTFEVSAFGGAAILIGTIGAIPQAAHQTAIAMASMTYMMASGIGAAATIKTAHNFGSKNLHELRLSAVSSYHIILVFMMITAALFISLNAYLPWLYTSDREVIAIASQLLIIAGLFQLFDGTQVIGLSVLRGLSDVNTPTVITFVAYWVIGIPIGYVLGITLGLGAKGVWYGLTLGLSISSGLIFLRFQRLTKKLEKNISRT